MAIRPINPQTATNSSDTSEPEPDKGVAHVGVRHPSRRTFMPKLRMRRTFGGKFPSRRTFGGKFPSRRTFGGKFPSRRTFGGKFA